MDFFEILTTILYGLQSFILILTLFFVARQTKFTRESIVELKNDIYRNTVAMDKVETREIGKLLLENEDIAKEMSYSKSDIIGIILLDNASQRYLLKEKGLINEETWKGHIVSLKGRLKRPFIREVLEKNKDHFDANFINYIYSNLLEETE